MVKNPLSNQEMAAEKTIKNMPRAKLLRKPFIILIVAVTLFTTFFTSVAQAAWDGSGDASGSGGSAVTGQFTLPHGNVNDLSGYRFTVFDANGKKVGHSIDVFATDAFDPGKAFRSIHGSNKKSHIELWKEYSKNKTASIGTPVSSTTSDPDAYEMDIPVVPTDVEEWLADDNASNASWVARRCGVTNWGTASNYLVCEPLFYAYLPDGLHSMTLAEYAVYQSSQYGWGDEKLPYYGQNNTYSIIMRALSGYYGRYLYAEGDYSDVFGTVENGGTLAPQPGHFKNDGGGTPSILFGSHRNYNTAEDVLKYQVGMAIYSDIIPTYTLTIDPNGGSYNGSTAITTQTVTQGASLQISVPVREGYAFAGWTVTGAGSMFKTHSETTRCGFCVCCKFRVVPLLPSTPEPADRGRRWASCHRWCPPAGR